MAVVLWSVLWMVVGLVGLALVLLIAVLALPFDGEAAGAVTDEQATGRLRARFGWGLLAVRAETGRGAELRIVGRRVSVREEAGAKTRAEKAPKRGEKRKPTRRRRGARDFWRARRGFRRVLGRVLGALHLRGRVAGVVGFDDPADTAALFGAMCVLAGRGERLALDVVPDWTEETLRLRGRLTCRFRLAAFVWIALRAFAESAVRRAVLGRRVPQRS